MLTTLPVSFTTFVKPRLQEVVTQSEGTPQEVPGLEDPQEFIDTVRELADLHEAEQLPQGYRAWYMAFPESGLKEACFRFPNGTTCRIQHDREEWIRIVEQDPDGSRKLVCAFNPNDPFNQSLQQILFPNRQVAETLLV